MKLVEKKYLMIFLMLAALFLGYCGQQGEETEVIDLKYIKTQDYLTDTKGEKIYLTKLNVLKGLSGDTLVALDGKERKVYLIDKSLNILKQYSLAKSDFMYTGELIDLTYSTGHFYIIDKSMTIKKFNIRTEEVEQISYGRERFIQFPGSIIINDDSSYIITSLIVQKGSVRIQETGNTDGIINKNAVSLGAWFNFRGKLKAVYEISVKEFDPESLDYVESCYTVLFENSVLFCFHGINQIYSFSIDGTEHRQYFLDVDKRFWQPPSIIYDRGLKKYRSLLVNNTFLQVHGNLIYFLQLRANNESPLLIGYNNNFEIKKIYRLPRINGIKQYYLSVIENEVYLLNKLEPTIIVYEFPK